MKLHLRWLTGVNRKNRFLWWVNLFKDNVNTLLNYKVVLFLIYSSCIYWYFINVCFIFCIC